MLKIWSNIGDIKGKFVFRFEFWSFTNSDILNFYTKLLKIDDKSIYKLSSNIYHFCSKEKIFVIFSYDKIRH